MVQIGGTAFALTHTIQQEESSCLYPGRVAFARDAGNGNWDIIEKNLDTLIETPIGATLGAEIFPSTAGKYTVFSRLSGNQYDLWAYDRVMAQVFPISQAPGDQWLASTDGRRVVWEDWRNSATAPDIYMRFPDSAGDGHLHRAGKAAGPGHQRATSSGLTAARGSGASMT